MAENRAEIGEIKRKTKLKFFKILTVHMLSRRVFFGGCEGCRFSEVIFVVKYASKNEM